MKRLKLWFYVNMTHLLRVKQTRISPCQTTEGFRPQNLWLFGGEKWSSFKWSWRNLQVFLLSPRGRGRNRNDCLQNGDTVSCYLDTLLLPSWVLLCGRWKLPLFDYPNKGTISRHCLTLLIWKYGKVKDRPEVLYLLNHSKACEIQTLWWGIPKNTHDLRPFL